MYQLIVTTRGNSYSVFGETLDKKDYPTIELGSTVFIPALDKMLIVTNEEAFVEITEAEKAETPEDTTTPSEDEVVEPGTSEEEEEEVVEEEEPAEDPVTPENEGTGEDITEE